MRNYLKKEKKKHHGRVKERYCLGLTCAYCESGDFLELDENVVDMRA